MFSNKKGPGSGISYQVVMNMCVEYNKNKSHAYCVNFSLNCMFVTYRIYPLAFEQHLDNQQTRLLQQDPATLQEG